MDTLELVVALMLATPQTITAEDRIETVMQNHFVEETTSIYAPIPAPQYYHTLEFEAIEDELVSHDELQEIIADQKLRNAGFTSGSDKGISPEKREEFKLYALCCWNFVMNRVAYVF